MGSNICPVSLINLIRVTDLFSIGILIRVVGLRPLAMAPPKVPVAALVERKFSSTRGCRDGFSVADGKLFLRHQREFTLSG